MTHTPCNICLMLHLLCDFGQGILHPRDSSPKGIILLLSDCSSKYITPDFAGYILFSINKERNVWFPQLRVIYCVPICCHTKLHCTESRFSFHHTGNNQQGNANRCTSGCDHLSCVDSKLPMLTLHTESLSVVPRLLRIPRRWANATAVPYYKTVRKQCFSPQASRGNFERKIIV